MAASITRADYDQLKQIADRFGAEAEHAQRTLQAIQQCVQTLQGGDWVGQGATAFYAEMNDAVLPSLRRLANALLSAKRTTLLIQADVKQTEGVTAAIFKLTDAGGAATSSSLTAALTGRAFPLTGVSGAPGLSAISGASKGFGGGLWYAINFQNKIDAVGNARLGFKPPKGRWERTFHLDGPHGKVTYPHFNAEAGPLKFLNHQRIPIWMQKLGNTKVLRGIGKATVVLGVAMDAYTIFTAAPNERGKAIGGVAG